MSAASETIYLQLNPEQGGVFLSDEVRVWVFGKCGLFLANPGRCIHLLIQCGYNSAVS